jgi:hypothetical protein
LNKSPSVNLAGDADAAGLAAPLAAVSILAFLRVRFSAGEAEAAAVLSAAGDVAAVASAFLCERRFPGDGDAAGDSAVEGDAAFSAGEAVASAFLCVRCFAVEGDAAGDSPGGRLTLHKTDAGEADYRNERKKFGSHHARV